MANVFKKEETPVEKKPWGSVKRVVDEHIGASKIGVLFVEVSPKTKPQGFHYHMKRESVYIGIKGKARVTIDKQEYVLEPNTVVLIPPGEKHRVENIGDIAFEYIEVYSPLEPDRIEVS